MSLFFPQLHTSTFMPGEIPIDRMWQSELGSAGTCFVDDEEVRPDLFPTPTSGGSKDSGLLTRPEAFSFRSLKECPLKDRAMIHRYDVVSLKKAPDLDRAAATQVLTSGFNEFREGRGHLRLGRSKNNKNFSITNNTHEPLYVVRNVGSPNKPLAVCVLEYEEGLSDPFTGFHESIWTITVIDPLTHEILEQRESKQETPFVLKQDDVVQYQRLRFRVPSADPLDVFGPQIFELHRKNIMPFPDETLVTIRYDDNTVEYAVQNNRLYRVLSRPPSTQTMIIEDRPVVPRSSERGTINRLLYPPTPDAKPKGLIVTQNASSGILYRGYAFKWKR